MQSSNHLLLVILISTPMQSSKSHSMSNSMLGHSRNLSDSGVHEKLEKPHPDKWPGHKRQLSDSFAASGTPSGAVSEAGCSDRYVMVT